MLLDEDKSSQSVEVTKLLILTFTYLPADGSLKYYCKTVQNAKVNL